VIHHGLAPQELLRFRCHIFWRPFRLCFERTSFYLSAGISETVSCIFLILRTY
jgi:hypothetical protein